jgi:hypothetical protein
MRKDPRVPTKHLAKKVRVTRNTAAKYLDEFIEDRILFPPQLRLKMTKQITEYVYLLKIKDPISFSEFIKNHNSVFYTCMLGGPFNILFMSYTPLTVSHLDGYEDTILAGIRSDYKVPTVQKRDFSTGWKIMMEKINNPPEKSMIPNTLPKGGGWTPELWELYNHLKYDVRIGFTPLVKKFKFHATTFYKRYRDLLTLTDVFVPFYPLGEKRYTSFYLLFETDYQQFIIDSFGELPVYSTHMRIKDLLLSYVKIPFGPAGETFLGILSLWQHKGIIDSFELSIPWWFEAASHPGMGPPPPISPNGTIPSDRGSGKNMLTFSI